MKINGHAGGNCLREIFSYSITKGAALSIFRGSLSPSGFHGLDDNGDGESEKKCCQNEPWPWEVSRLARS